MLPKREAKRNGKTSQGVMERKGGGGEGKKKQPPTGGNPPRNFLLLLLALALSLPWLSPKMQQLSSRLEGLGAKGFIADFQGEIFFPLPADSLLQDAAPSLLTISIPSCCLPSPLGSWAQNLPLEPILPKGILQELGWAQGAVEEPGGAVFRRGGWIPLELLGSLRSKSTKIKSPAWI